MAYLTSDDGFDVEAQEIVDLTGFGMVMPRTIPAPEPGPFMTMGWPMLPAGTLVDTPKGRVRLREPLAVRRVADGSYVPAGAQPCRAAGLGALGKPTAGPRTYSVSRPRSTRVMMMPPTREATPENAVAVVQRWINLRAFGRGSGRRPIAMTGSWDSQTEWGFGLAGGPSIVRAGILREVVSTHTGVPLTREQAAAVVAERNAYLGGG